MSDINSMKDLRFGVELEVVGVTRTAIAEAIATVLGVPFDRITRRQSYDTRTIRCSDGRKWTVVSDASLTGAEWGNSGEVVSPILTYADLDTVQAIVRGVRDIAGAKVDASCGIHIHVDGAPFKANLRGLANLVKMVYKQEALIVGALGILPSRHGYCKDIDDGFMTRLGDTVPATMEEFARIWYGSDPAVREAQQVHYHQTRYHGVNIHSLIYRGTVEFRWFNSTLNSNEVKAYVQFILAIAFKALSMTRNASSSRRVSRPDNTKWEFRVFLKDLGLVGDEFEGCRFNLMKRLEGSSREKKK